MNVYYCILFLFNRTWVGANITVGLHRRKTYSSLFTKLYQILSLTLFIYFFFVFLHKIQLLIWYKSINIYIFLFFFTNSSASRQFYILYCTSWNNHCIQFSWIWCPRPFWCMQFSCFENLHIWEIMTNLF